MTSREKQPGNLNTRPARPVEGHMVSITQSLVVEHAVFNRMFDEIEAVLATSASVPEMQALSRVVEGLLAEHGKMETDVAYPVLDHVLAERAALNGLHEDGNEIDENFKRISSAANAVEARQLFRQGLAAARARFRREEKNEFPILERTLQPDTLFRLGRERMGGKACAMD
jgi:hypothetical protein